MFSFFAPCSYGQKFVGWFTNPPFLASCVFLKLNLVPDDISNIYYIVLICNQLFHIFHEIKSVTIQKQKRIFSLKVITSFQPIRCNYLYLLYNLLQREHTGLLDSPSVLPVNVGIQEWKQLETFGHIPSARCWFGYCVLNSKLWVFGGVYSTRI